MCVHIYIPVQTCIYVRYIYIYIYIHASICKYICFSISHCLPSRHQSLQPYLLSAVFFGGKLYTTVAKRGSAPYFYSLTRLQHCLHDGPR